MEKNKNKESNKEKHIAMARKLLELAKRGDAGEKDSAKTKFEEHMKRHGLHISDIDPSANMRRFKVKSDDDRMILANVILSVNPFSEIIKLTSGLNVELDEEDFIEVREKFKYFSRLYKVEKQMLTDSFFHKHKDYFQPDEYTRNKWREKRKINEDLQSVQIKVEKIQNKLSKTEEDKLNKQMQEHVKKMRRMEAMSKTLLNAEYARRGELPPTLKGRGFG